MQKFQALQSENNLFNLLPSQETIPVVRDEWANLSPKISSGRSLNFVKKNTNSTLKYCFLSYRSKLKSWLALDRFFYVVRIIPKKLRKFCSISFSSTGTMFTKID